MLALVAAILLNAGKKQFRRIHPAPAPERTAKTMKENMEWAKQYNQIEARIEDARETLSSNLHKLERKVKSVTDWKQQFQKHPTAMLGIAFGGGILLATMLPNRRSRRRNFATVP
jgi:hypothetical protein